MKPETKSKVAYRVSGTLNGLVGCQFFASVKGSTVDCGKPAAWKCTHRVTTGPRRRPVETTAVAYYCEEHGTGMRDYLQGLWEPVAPNMVVSGAAAAPRTPPPTGSVLP
ncbi:MAG: hypothetical protein WC455_20330 [Dehalococcoidia bacterium]|jgi:hypothetical protein